MRSKPAMHSLFSYKPKAPTKHCYVTEQHSDDVIITIAQLLDLNTKPTSVIWMSQMSFNFASEEVIVNLAKNDEKHDKLLRSVVINEATATSLGSLSVNWRDVIARPITWRCFITIIDCCVGRLPPELVKQTLNSWSMQVSGLKQSF